MAESARPATAAVLTLGCKLNIADSEAMARRLREGGWLVSDRLSDVDAVIVNSCSVTQAADRKSRHLVHLAHRLAPRATVALTGCLVETASTEALSASGADFVYRQPQQMALAQRLIELRPDVQPIAVQTRPSLRTRAFISAQEGCNDVCAFCIIPRTRGRERSKPISAVVEEVLARQAEGVQEVVITGTQLGAYGRDGHGDGPASLLRALLRETSVARIRMSSLQPQDISDELIELWQDARPCRHFHLALQSGSESVLRRMRRRYSVEEYRDAVTRLRAAIPDVAITTDVIAGFPGETQAEFEESLAFSREMAFADMHVFPYSQRRGTVAFGMAGQVDEASKKQRVHRLIELGEAMSRTYRQRFLGSEVSVLWETRGADGAWEGLTDTYLRVHTRCNEDLANRLSAVHLTELDQSGLRGELMP